jgi:hypothetical protein
VLRKHGYQLDDNYPLAMESDNQSRSLTFCPIDPNIILIIEYTNSTNMVTSLSVAFFPDNSTSKLHQLVRRIREITFEDEGIYTLKLNRLSKRAKEQKR